MHANANRQPSADHPVGAHGHRRAAQRHPHAACAIHGHRHAVRGAHGYAHRDPAAQRHSHADAVRNAHAAAHPAAAAFRHPPAAAHITATSGAHSHGHAGRYQHRQSRRHSHGHAGRHGYAGPNRNPYPRSHPAAYHTHAATAAPLDAAALAAAPHRHTRGFPRAARHRDANGPALGNPDPRSCTGRYGHPVALANANGRRWNDRTAPVVAHTSGLHVGAPKHDMPRTAPSRRDAHRMNSVSDTSNPLKRVAPVGTRLDSEIVFGLPNAGWCSQPSQGVTGITPGAAG